MITIKDFENIVKEYVGTIIRETDRVVFKNKNTLFKSGNVYNEKTDKITFVENKPVKVDCEFEFCNGGQFNGCEKTYEILGGFGLPSATEKDIRKQLDRFNFKHKEVRYEQLTLF